MFRVTKLLINSAITSLVLLRLLSYHHMSLGFFSIESANTLALGQSFSAWKLGLFNVHQNMYTWCTCKDDNWWANSLLWFQTVILCCRFFRTISIFVAEFSRCQIFRCPFFPLPFFSVAFFPLPLFHTLFLCCPVFLPSYFSLPIFHVVQFSGCRFFCYRFFSVSLFTVAVLLRITYACYSSPRSLSYSTCRHIVQLSHRPLTQFLSKVGCMSSLK